MVIDGTVFLAYQQRELGFNTVRWEEAVAVPIENVDLDRQGITVDRTASESGGKRDIRNDGKTVPRNASRLSLTLPRPRYGDSSSVEPRAANSVAACATPG
jgi:hypothetical protein